MSHPLTSAALALLMLAPSTSLAQTGYGRPTPQQYRSERRTTAALNDAVDSDDEDQPAEPWGNRYAASAPYDRSPRDPATARDWREHVEACRRGNRAACERTGELAAGVGARGYEAGYAAPDPGYAYQGARRYEDLRDAYDPRYDGRPPAGRYDDRYARGDYDDAEEPDDDGGR